MEIQTVLDAYGPHAFGLVSLLVLWFVIMRPELQARRADFEAQLSIVAQLKTTARSLAATAEVLERVTRRVEK